MKMRPEPQIAQISPMREGRHRFYGTELTVPHEFAQPLSPKSPPLIREICAICGFQVSLPIPL